MEMVRRGEFNGQFLPTPPMVLFMCPHGAAKSVLAAGYFNAAATVAGSNYRAIARGTHPDEVIGPRALALLHEQGLAPVVNKPQKVDPSIMQSAHTIVSLGCDMADLPINDKNILRWDDLPAVSEKPEAASAEIMRRVQALLKSIKHCGSSRKSDVFE